MKKWTDHCSICEDFNTWCTDYDVPYGARVFMQGLWWNHQDIQDDLRCWNAYCSVYDPSRVVEIEE